MKNKNLILRYFGLSLIMVGIVLNIKMYLYKEWSTYLFYLLCLIGIVQAIFSFTMKEMGKIWQILWIIIPFLIVVAFFNTLS